MDVNFPTRPDKWIRVTPKIARDSRDTSTVEGEEDAKLQIREALMISGPGNPASGANALPLPKSPCNEWRTPNTNTLGEPMT